MTTEVKDTQRQEINPVIIKWQFLSAPSTRKNRLNSKISQFELDQYENKP
jgi:hypothetical protein